MTQSAKNTLSALSGFPVKDDALKGFATGNRTGKPAKREQEILTPQVVIDVCKQVWPEGIVLDPCWAPGALTSPVFVCHEKGPDGLNTPWVPRTFVNPPYKDLKAWLAYGRTQPSEQIWLVPVRTHRRWFRRWRDHEIDAYCELDPIAFLGFDQVFPAPLLLGYRGDLVQEFKKASQHLGDVY